MLTYAELQVLLADLNHKGSLQTFLSIAFMYVRNKEGQAPCTTLTGMQDGCLYLWNRCVCSADVC